jgi:hypothetical protein
LFRGSGRGGRENGGGRTEGRLDRQTDMKKVIVAFRNFANAPKKRNLDECDNWPSENIRITTS